MNLTARYTFFVLLIFAGVFLLSFFLIASRTEKGMLDVASSMIHNNVFNVKKIAEYQFYAIPYIALHPTASASANWLTAESYYFGSSASEVNLVFEYSWTDEGGFIEFSGFLGMFAIRRARVNLNGFFDWIIKNIQRVGGGYFYVVDPYGNAVYHSIKERLKLNLVEEGLSDLLAKMKREKEGFLEYEYKGKTIRAYFSALDFPWKVVYYDQAGNERKLELYVVNAITLDEISAWYKPFMRYMYVVLFPVMIAMVAVASYLTAILAVRKIRSQSRAIKEFSDSVSNTAVNISTSAAEMEKIAENNSEVARRLAEITQNFATSAEEGRYEVDNSVHSIRSFLDLLSKVGEEINRAVGLIESLNDLNERITYLSDTISVLAINASIESSKEKIDREGIAKIVEHITRVSKEARETSKQTKKTIDQIQKSLSQLALYSERVEKEGNAVRMAIDNISQVMESFIKGVSQIRNVSESLMRSSDETSAGVEDIVQSLNELRESLDKLSSMIKVMKI